MEMRMGKIRDDIVRGDLHAQLERLEARELRSAERFVLQRSLPELEEMARHSGVDWV